MQYSNCSCHPSTVVGSYRNPASKVALCCSITRRKSNLADMFEAMQGPLVDVTSSHRWYIISSAKQAETGAMMQVRQSGDCCLQPFKAQEQSGRYDGGHAGAACTVPSQVRLDHACIGKLRWCSSLSYSAAGVLAGSIAGYDSRSAELQPEGSPGRHQ